MWPSNHSDPQPETCISNPNEKGGSLDLAQLPMELRNNLMRSWPSYSGTGNPAIFWQLEWRKHGTCSFNKFNQIKYFYEAFNNWNGMGLYDLLRFEGIVPGASQTAPKTYDKMKFIEAIKRRHFRDEVTVIPQFYCNKGTDLREIRMCIDYNGFEYMNCTGTSTSLVGTCGNQIQWYA
ncbi:ribonuclease 1-like [Trifolium medium]|uniref:Ribonuclease 1-like n=1 Tax=Trifolium medium TaxID=97028 RepID=A0A392M319_9FABA|nr:ribonuclease 1-like [Trifolium medium]